MHQSPNTHFGYHTDRSPKDIGQHGRLVSIEALILHPLCFVSLYILDSEVSLGVELIYLGNVLICSLFILGLECSSPGSFRP